MRVLLPFRLRGVRACMCVCLSCVCVCPVCVCVCMFILCVCVCTSGRNQSQVWPGSCPATPRPQVVCYPDFPAAAASGSALNGPHAAHSHLLQPPILSSFSLPPSGGPRSQPHAQASVCCSHQDPWCLALFLLVSGKP